MADKEQKAVDPAPVDVKSSVPLEVKIAPESIAALGGDAVAVAEQPVLPVAPVAVPQVTTTTTTTAPVPVTVVKGEGLTLAPQTTEQQDIVTAGQRRVSLLWESTQATMAVMVTMAMIYTAIMQIESLVLTSAFFLIVGTYFNRTNSHLIGGIGPKATDYQPYRGR